MRKFLKESAVILVLALILAVTLKAYVVEARTLTTDSLQPLFQPSDHLIVNKISFTVNPGDIVLFKNNSEDYMRQVLSVDGDKIAVSGVGVIDKSNIIGKAFGIYYPLNKARFF